MPLLIDYIRTIADSHVRSGATVSSSSDVPALSVMSEVNGVLKEPSQLDPGRPSTGRVVSASMMRSGMLCFCPLLNLALDGWLTTRGQ